MATYRITHCLYPDRDSKYTKALDISDDREFLTVALKLLEDQSLPKFGGDRGELFFKPNRKGQMRKTNAYLSHAHDWICWNQTGLMASLKKSVRRLEIAHIVRVDEGLSSTNFVKANQLTPMDQEVSNRAFSLIAHHRTVSLIARSVQVCNIWVRALNILVARMRNVGLALEPSSRNAFHQYLQEQWNRADTDRNGTIDPDELYSVMQKMNTNTNKKLIEKLIKRYKLDKSRIGLNFSEFTEFFRELFSDRSEVMEILNALDRLKRKMGLDVTRSTKDVKEIRVTAEDLCVFYNHFQRDEDEPEKTVDMALEEIKELAENEDETEWTIVEFAQYLDHEKNSIFDPTRLVGGVGCDIDKYMSFPLSHYWINSSHNTYLTGDQLQGVSSADQYTYVLQSGCRCVELDCWDGEKNVPPGNAGDEPVITHGHTMCTKIFFRDVIKTVKTRAFGPPANNPYPVILSIEMHCSTPFQEKMYEICVEELGDMLYLLPPDCDDMTALPSPHDLKGKVLLKGKKKVGGPRNVTDEDSQGQEDDDDNLENENVQGAKQVPRASSRRDYLPLKRSDTGGSSGKEWASDSSHVIKQGKVHSRFDSLISLVGKHWKGLDHPAKVFEMYSYSENKALKLSSNSRAEWIDFNLRQLARVYPKGTRVDSSNLDPIRPWGAGCQLVALNFQTGDEPIQLNFGRFIENKNLGYVLLPAFMRRTGIPSIAVRMNIRVLSGQRLPNNHASRDIADVFCKVAVHGVGTDSKEFTTEVVMDNGFNPVFSRDVNGFDFEISDRHVRNIRSFGLSPSFDLTALISRDCAMLRFSIWDQDATMNEFIGHMSLPVTCVRTGYRHVPLYDTYNSRLGISCGILCFIKMDPV